MTSHKDSKKVVIHARRWRHGEVSVKPPNISGAGKLNPRTIFCPFRRTELNAPIAAAALQKGFLTQDVAVVSVR